MSDFQGEKEKLELEKLKFEVKIQKRFFRNPSNWAPFATIIAAGFAIIYAFFTGWFNLQNDIRKNENTKLEISKENLKRDINIFKNEKALIADSIKKLRRDLLEQSELYISLKLTLSEKNEILSNDKKELTKVNAKLNSIMDSINYAITQPRKNITTLNQENKFDLYKTTHSIRFDMSETIDLGNTDYSTNADKALNMLNRMKDLSDKSKYNYAGIEAESLWEGVLKIFKNFLSEWEKGKLSSESINKYKKELDSKLQRLRVIYIHKLDYDL